MRKFEVATKEPQVMKRLGAFGYYDYETIRQLGNRERLLWRDEPMSFFKSFRKLIGSVADGPDVSLQHDEYLYGRAK